jgi:hypothetical protein
MMHFILFLMQKLHSRHNWRRWEFKKIMSFKQIPSSYKISLLIILLLTDGKTLITKCRTIQDLFMNYRRTMMCRREREIYKSKIPKTPSTEFLFFAAGDGNS